MERLGPSYIEGLTDNGFLSNDYRTIDEASGLLRVIGGIPIVGDSLRNFSVGCIMLASTLGGYVCYLQTPSEEHLYDSPPPRKMRLYHVPDSKKK